MFKFGFSSDDNDKEKDDTEKQDTCSKKWLESEEVKIGNNSVPEELLREDCSDVEYIDVEGKYKLRHVSIKIVTEMVNRLKDRKNSIFKSEQKHSDLITTVYEGGLKIWQCTYDLLEYIYAQDFKFAGTKVLDLGCGAGILGIYAFVNGAKVYFQDYNPEVVKYVTLPNVLLNAKDDNKAENCRFYSGDWKSFVGLTAADFANDDDKFDYILTSETIYNCDNYSKLILLFKSLLKQNGAIYLAAKTYYFGVGGGTRQFEELLKKDDCFNFENSWSTKEGVQREILKLTFK